MDKADLWVDAKGNDCSTSGICLLTGWIRRTSSKLVIGTCEPPGLVTPMPRVVESFERARGSSRRVELATSTQSRQMISLSIGLGFA